MESKDKVEFKNDVIVGFNSVCIVLLKIEGI